MRTFEPLQKDHPLATDGTMCATCGKRFVEGDVLALVAVGPGTDSEEREKRDKGKPYIAIAVPVHAECGPKESSGEYTSTEDQ